VKPEQKIDSSITVGKDVLAGKPEGSLDADRRTILKSILNKQARRIHVAQNRGQWWALVNTVMNLLVP
jgi:hypothetical protein